MVDYKYLDLHTCYMYSQMYVEAIICDGDLMKAVIEDEE